MGARRTRAISAAAQDRFSAEHLIDAAGDVVRHVARMRARAEQEGTRLLTFAIDTEVSFATPADLERFTTALAEFVAREAAGVPQPRGRPPLPHPARRPSGARHRSRQESVMPDRVLVEILVAAPIETVWKALREPVGDPPLVRLELSQSGRKTST